MSHHFVVCTTLFRDVIRPNEPQHILNHHGDTVGSAVERFNAHRDPDAQITWLTKEIVDLLDFSK